jgi:hypothetical protein
LTDEPHHPRLMVIMWLSVVDVPDDPDCPHRILVQTLGGESVPAALPRLLSIVADGAHHMILVLHTKPVHQSGEGPKPHSE